MTTLKGSRRSAPKPRPRATSGKQLPAEYIAVIGDVIRSRRLTPGARRDIQRRLDTTLQQLNLQYRRALAAKLLITVGDEFQGLFRDGSILPELIRRLEVGLREVDVRLGIGRGAVYTDLKDYAIGMDGPAWHAARVAIEDAKLNRRLGGVFVGFGRSTDVVLNGFARVLHYVRSRLTVKQRHLLEALLETETQAEIAVRTGITKQAVSKQARAAGGDAYREAESAWKLVLSISNKSVLNEP
jgi:hypothetical protein